MPGGGALQKGNGRGDQASARDHRAQDDEPEPLWAWEKCAMGEKKTGPVVSVTMFGVEVTRCSDGGLSLGHSDEEHMYVLFDSLEELESLLEVFKSAVATADKFDG